MSAQWGYPSQPQEQAAVEYAGWWWRVLASIIDGLISFGFLLAAGIPFGVVGYLTLSEETLNTVIDIASIPYTIAFLLLYYPLTMRREGAHNGQTWGKQACNIRVVRTDGLPMDAATAIMREAVIKYLLFSTLAACALFIPTLLDYLWPLWDDRNQALHDKLANTYVVRGAAPPPPAPTWEPPVPPSGSGPVQWGS